MPSYGKNPARGLADRICPKCNVVYSPYRATQLACSRKCRERLPGAVVRQRAYNQDSEVRERKNSARRVSTDPGRREKNLRQNLQKYGVSPEEFRASVIAQGGQCAICGAEPDPGARGPASRLHVDHDHATGANRGLLCVRCNPGLGYFKDDPALLRAAADYIERHRN